MDHSMVFLLQLLVTGTNKYTSVMGHFDGHAAKWVQCRAHCSMQHVQGYTRCPWTLPTGEYLLHITPGAARGTGKKTMMKNTTTLLAITMAMGMHQYDATCIT
jgi:hypothetical protein